MKETNKLIEKDGLLEEIRNCILGCQVEDDNPCIGCERKGDCEIPEIYNKVKAIIIKYLMNVEELVDKIWGLVQGYDTYDLRNKDKIRKLLKEAK